MYDVDRLMASLKDKDMTRPIKTVNGNLITLGLEGHLDVIIHGCNCYHQWGKGIAKELGQRIPEAWVADLRTRKGDRSKLGTYSQATVEVDRPHSMMPHRLTVINGYTQEDTWSPGVRADYNAIRKIFRDLKQDLGGQALRFGIPRIGAGLARGNWDIIVSSILEEMVGEDLLYVEYTQQKVT